MNFAGIRINVRWQMAGSSTTLLLDGLINFYVKSLFYAVSIRHVTPKLNVDCGNKFTAWETRTFML
jgi:hypothetical protein